MFLRVRRREEVHSPNNKKGKATPRNRFLSPGAKTVITDNDLHSAFTVYIVMDPVFPLPLQERVLREVVDKAKDYALMHGGHTDEIQRPLTRTA